MNRKCDQCDRKATHHSVEIVDGEKIQKHLCDLHAAEQGLSVKASHLPINELLTNYIKQKAGDEPDRPKTRGLSCEVCGTTFAHFRESSLLGCPHCYQAFERPLGALLERAHEGGTHHVGKAPRRTGANEERQTVLTRMRTRLDDAVATEDYELAARLRDEIQQYESKTR